MGGAIATGQTWSLQRSQLKRVGSKCDDGTELDPVRAGAPLSCDGGRAIKPGQRVLSQEAHLAWAAIGCIHGGGGGCIRVPPRLGAPGTGGHGSLKPSDETFGMVETHT